MKRRKLYTRHTGGILGDWVENDIFICKVCLSKSVGGFTEEDSMDSVEHMLSEEDCLVRLECPDSPSGKHALEKTFCVGRFSHEPTPGPLYLHTKQVCKHCYYSRCDFSDPIQLYPSWF